MFDSIARNSGGALSGARPNCASKLRISGLTCKRIGVREILTINSANLAAQVQALPTGAKILFRESSFDLNGKPWVIDKGGELVLSNKEVSAEGIRQLTLEAFGFEDHKKTGLRKTNAERRMTEREWLTMFFFYLANYAVITYFNVAFASIVLDHLAGGGVFCL